jgi:hypothetical protein
MILERAKFQLSLRMGPKYLHSGATDAANGEQPINQDFWCEKRHSVQRYWYGFKDRDTIGKGTITEWIMYWLPSKDGP